MASRTYQTYTYVHVTCNAVTLVWGSLRLAPITLACGMECWWPTVTSTSVMTYLTVFFCYEFIEMMNVLDKET